MVDDNLTNALKLIEAMNTINPSKETSNTKDKYSNIISIMPILFTIIGAIFYSGVQANQWSESVDKLKLEVENKIIEKQSFYQDKTVKFQMDIGNEIKLLSDRLRSVELEKEALVNNNNILKQEVESLKRSNDDLYRTQQYLKSLHDAK